MPPSENKERHFCFVYFGNRMNAPDFSQMHISLAEGCCFEEKDGRMVQFVRISLHQKNGRRIGTIPRIIEEYNRMEGRVEKIEPVVYHPLLNASAVVCFKTTAPIQLNPILARIAMAKNKESSGFWRWTEATGIISAVAKTQHKGKDRRAYTSILEILREMQLPEAVVSVQRVYSELSEPYFGHYQTPLGEGTGCVPVEHRAFIISEIKRLFEEELSYTEQPSVRVLPPQARSLIDGDLVDIFPAAAAATAVVQPTIRFERVINTEVCRIYTKTSQDATPRIDKPLGSFLTFYALQWNDACLESVCYPVKALHRGWIDALLDFSDLQRRIIGANLEGAAVVQGLMLKVPSVKALLKLLCTEGLIVPAAATYTPKLDRLFVDIESKPVAPIVEFFKTMLADGWAAEKSVQVTATDVIKVLNCGEGGTYKQACVRQFMRPFIHNESVVGYMWTVGAYGRERYVVDVERVERCIAGLGE